MKYQGYLDATAELLRESQKEKRPYHVEILGQKFLVYPGVFSPKYFLDTEIFAKLLPVSKGERFLEIGTGTGVIAIVAAKKGAKVVAVDINPLAVKNARANVRLHGLQRRVGVRQGNLFEPIPDDEKFDTIFWNVPFGYVPNRRRLTLLEQAVFDPGYQNLKGFLRNAKQHLNSRGKVLIGFSSTLGKTKFLKKLSAEAGFKLRMLRRIGSRERYPVFFELWEQNNKPRRE